MTLSSFKDKVSDPVTYSEKELPNHSFYWSPEARQWLMNWWASVTKEFTTQESVTNVWKIVHNALFEHSRLMGSSSKAHIPTMFYGLLELVPDIKLSQQQKKAALQELKSRIEDTPYHHSGQRQVRVSGFWGGASHQMEKGTPFVDWSNYLPNNKIDILTKHLSK